MEIGTNIWCACPDYFLGPWIYNQILVQPYVQYLERDLVAFPLYEKLNMEVISQIPVPEGVLEIKRYSTGLHGATFFVDYEYENTTWEKVFLFYDDFLLAEGWQRSETELYTYQKDTSCFSLSSHIPDSRIYEVSIEHDYFKQDFTPKMPPMWLIYLHELGESPFSGCENH